MAPPPVRLAPGVWRIPLIGRSLVNGFALEDDTGGVTLIDAGFGWRAAPRVLRALEHIGRRPDEVRALVLTHAHRDHLGGAARLRTVTGAPVSSHERDAAAIRRGRQEPVDRVNPLAPIVNRIGLGMPACPVDAEFADGELLDLAGGLRVLHTPGHSPGHCSFLHERSGVLITGDALFNFLDRISYSNALFCSNVRLSRETADRLGDADYGIAAFTHGRAIRDRAREQVRDFLQRRPR